ncbi:hypothetical protein Acy02nite_47520 [Actinoplanes cyaneus]|uniref:Secreted protein n=1 Tax=Actinoplanes cyaneus TaxID=52696 RepID=A0A919IKR3_9ACTN|nr:hypothetical protein [Actinoplanes cyaneus]GID66871.1 hypothetical protein Acy02nite_47520 [Actinoplanes cyaneus]
MKIMSGVSVTTLLVSLVVGVSPAAAAPQRTERPFRIAAECTTEPTDRGVRKSCDSDVTSFPAPAGFWIDQSSVKGEYTSAAGSENSINITYDGLVPVIANVPQTALPTIINVSVHARSPKGLSPRRGWSKAIVTGTMFSLS